MTQRSALRIFLIAAALLFIIFSVARYFETRSIDRRVKALEQDVKQIEEWVDAIQEQIDAAKKAAKKAGE